MSKAVDLQLEARNLLIKFEYAFAGLIFAILAFSIQFTSTNSKTLLWMLVVSWALLLTAGLVAGWRTYLLGEFSHLDSLRFKESERKANKENFTADPNLPNLLRLGRIIDPATGRKWTEEDLKADIKQVGENVELLTSKQTELNGKLTCLFKIQVGSFALGMIGLAIFNSINLFTQN